MNHKEFIEKYLSLANQWSYKNELMNTSGMLVLLGQCLKKNKFNVKGSRFDSRVHSFCVQKSGTGKAPALHFLREMSNKIGLRSDILTSLTSAGLIGTISGDEVIYGSAYKNDIIMVQEASILFSNRESSKDLLYQINQIMDTNGTVNKIVARGSISYETTTSLFLTTHPLKTKIKEFIEIGFFPRFLLSFREVSEQSLKEIKEWMINNINEPMRENGEEIIETLKRIKESNFNFSFKRGIFKIIDKKLEGEKEKYSLNTQELAQLYTTRFLINGIKIASAFAALDSSEVVREEHVEKASEILSLFWNSVLEFIEKQETNRELKEIEKFRERLDKLFDKFGEELHTNILMQYTRLPRKKIDNLVSTLVANDEIKIIRKSRKGYYIKKQDLISK